nr:hypothetical protein [Sphingomonas sp. CDS-1]
MSKLDPICFNQHSTEQPKKTGTAEWGDRIFLAYASSNHDVEMFAQSDEVVPDRASNWHVGLGGGQHPCLGFFFAWMMFQTLLAEILRRISGYQVVEEKIERKSIGSVNGPVHAPVILSHRQKKACRYEGDTLCVWGM